jgi:hypothetical protein
MRFETATKLELKTHGIVVDVQVADEHIAA